MCVRLVMLSSCLSCGSNDDEDDDDDDDDDAAAAADDDDDATVTPTLASYRFML